MNESRELFPGADSRQETILIVDDDPSNLAVVTEYLQESEFEVLVAEDGRIALERARLARPNLILLDVLMPDMDGFETCRRLKEDEFTRDIPVIFMTALADTENKVKGFAAGAVDYLTKPSQREEVLARVGVHLHIQQLTRDLKKVNASLESRVEERTAALKAEIAERRQAEEALRKSEERFRALYEQNPTMYFTLDGQGTVLSVNPFGAEQLGYTVQELIAQPVLQVFHPDDRVAVREQLQKCLGQKDRVCSWELRKMRKDGSMLWVREAARCVQGGDGQPVVLVVCEDITDRKKADEALAESKDFLDKIINSISEPIFVKDREHRWVLLNDALCRFMGHERKDLLGKSDYDFFPKEQADVFWEKDDVIFDSGEANINEEQISDANGKVHTIVTTKTLYRDESGEAFIVGIINDITERMNLEAQLRQAVKMEAVGLLAGGVAHDFNNLLTAVNGYSDLLLRQLGEDNPLRKDIEQINRAGLRAASLTGQLLAFSRKQVVKPEVLDLNHVIRETEKMLKRLIGENIELATVLDPELGRVVADPGLIEQVIINLVVNARDAMPKGGKLTIETRNVVLDDSYAQWHVEVEPGNYVLVTLSDTGIGMDEHTLSHIFEPFFTTKTKGTGTGLGLATVFGIVKQSGGNIGVYSEPGRGSTFKIYLPQVEEEKKTVQEDSSALELARGSEVILLVEDDETVLDLVSTTLKISGYTVIEAHNGREALKICEEKGHDIKLLITDVIMPGLDGSELAQSIKAIHPNIRVLFISGYADSAIVQHGVLQPGMAFLQKPFTSFGLSRKVREVLDKAQK
ncbi:MAG TPA: hybrid sensor histidine kinase/response regulator [Desulfobulbaceae bacterium]|nr:hybrid sensor histidine kinase/response regulator [Desulfobulbaceae bacterium]